MEGGSIVELLDKAGVDHVANGLQIILKGSTARLNVSDMTVMAAPMPMAIPTPMLGTK